ncbi:metallo-beta-lactamase superfamily protein [Nocardia neocaledoniensis]|uniref:Metallo-beta-lactamase superfamily protein n=2 Tax=Nocardia neocaledoniensis TaxID=236511 RepID=A0A317N7Q0_9NOCA|nr:metallo-beta-lactamase superfamily protein [Nocardia neocaledoniensis]
MIGGLVDHCLLIETARGLVLVDTGFGSADVADPARLGWSRRLFRPRLDPRVTARSQIESFGYRDTDVTDIVLTHLDYDHAGGLADFPAARIHVHGPELRAAQSPRWAERPRYRPAQWEHGPRWVVNEAEGSDTWFGLDAVRALPGLGTDILVVPLYGHTRGHVGVAVNTPAGWLLHAGDALLTTRDLDDPVRRMMVACYGGPGLRAAAARWNNTRALADLTRREPAVTVFTAHDRQMFTTLRTRATGAGDRAS